MRVAVYEMKGVAETALMNFWAGPSRRRRALEVFRLVLPLEVSLPLPVAVSLSLAFAMVSRS